MVPVGQPVPVQAWGQPPVGVAGASASNALAPQPTSSGMSKTTLMLIGFVLVPLVIILLIVLVKAFSMPAITPPVDVTPTSTTPTTTTGTTDPGGGEYQNDDYQVPDPDPNPPRLPAPETYGEAEDWMQNNAFYSGRVPSPVRCEVDAVPPTAAKAQLSKYLNQITGCLMRVWANELNGAGYHATRPTVHVYSEGAQSACGKLSSGNAYFCSADQQIYYAQDFYTRMPQFKDEWIMPMSTVAHEFGHGLQGMTGVLYSEAGWEQRLEEDGDVDGSLELSRRLEFQADCYAGVFIGAVSQSIGVTDEIYQVLLEIMIAKGDDTQTGDPEYVGGHGRGYNRQAWLVKGTKSSAIGTCNSFADGIPPEDLL